MKSKTVNKKQEGRSLEHMVRSIVACEGGGRQGAECECPRCMLAKIDTLHANYRLGVRGAEARLGEWMFSARKESGLSLRAVAVAAGVSAAFLCDMEHGRRTPKPSTLDRLLKAVGADAASGKLCEHGGPQASANTGGSNPP